jgi:hypothetical protein
MDPSKKQYDPIDDDVINLKGKCIKDPQTGLLALFDAMVKYQDHRDFFKIKEVFVNQIEQYKELPDVQLSTTLQIFSSTTNKQTSLLNVALLYAKNIRLPLHPEVPELYHIDQYSDESFLQAAEK